MFRQILVLVFYLFVKSSAFVGHRSLFLASSTAIASSVTETMPEAKAGDTIPDVTLKELLTGADKPEEVKLSDLIKGKKVAIFGVPGAFTPGTCGSDTQG